MNLRGNPWNVILKLLKKLERSQHLETEYACVAASYGYFVLRVRMNKRTLVDHVL
jgi:hypothetical protein